jgi:hypothetical protein
VRQLVCQHRAAIGGVPFAPIGRQQHQRPAPADGRWRADRTGLANGDRVMTTQGPFESFDFGQQMPVVDRPGALAIPCDRDQTNQQANQPDTDAGEKDDRQHCGPLPFARRRE